VTPAGSAYAQVILDIPARALDAAFDYRVPPELLGRAQVGCCVLVDFNRRPALGYLVSLSAEPRGELAPEKVKPLREVLSEPYFDTAAAELARWIADEYLAPLSEAIHLFTPPGASPRLRRFEDKASGASGETCERDKSERDKR
jgi:primosomal protein N' (replication factor Y)